MKKLIGLLGALVAITAANAQGTFEAITDYTPGSDSASIPGTGGWTFQPLIGGLTITDLGCLGILLSTYGTIDIGLWNSNGVSLASVSITPTNSSSAQPEYSSITPVLLDPSQTYYLGAYWPGAATPDHRIGMSLAFPAPSTNGSVTLSSDLKLGSYAYTTDGSFGFPGNLGTDGQMLLGPTFVYTKNVPEPALLGLLCLGSLGWLIGRQRH